MNSKEILNVLDRCCDNFTFPMLDNGYVYLAASRLSLYRSASDWAIVVEVFGFSPRSGIPHTQIATFGSNLFNRQRESEFVSHSAFRDYIEANPNNETRFVFPIEEGHWMQPDDWEVVNNHGGDILIRGHRIPVPSRPDYAVADVSLTDPNQIYTFELCRLLAANYRELVMATPDERRYNIPLNLEHVMQLEEWNHPDVADDSHRPGVSETFQQLAEVLVSGDLKVYKPSLPPNTHWKNWPDGGTL
ncbi:DUF7003 family protein [Leptonema illini]|uniref:Uncharacterized protein n=1 Tax=Leptonema illini DSM 21528 TaxID=929563 RepID=H2CJ56_9LEPT|nr:hypothetical protein [Leptonema illini]EHQ04973.1 hypothetical protein Lepil_0266 [Leptonema illini DSM 21528]